VGIVKRRQIRYGLLVVCCGTASAQQWQPSLASAASLRTARATLVSSDVLKKDGDRVALITYWEARTSDNLDVYRCVDLVDSAFKELGEQCWRALRPTGRGPIVTKGVVSSNDICRKPDNLNGFSEAAYCSFERRAVIATPYFRLVIEPFQDRGLVAVSDQGHTLLVTNPPWPGSAFFEVRATNRRDRALFAAVKTTRAIPSLADDKTNCKLVTVSNREWAACRSDDAPNVRTYYLVRDDLLYEVSVTANAPDAARAVLDRMLSTLEPIAQEL
jgi:hypothetical protein